MCCLDYCQCPVNKAYTSERFPVSASFNVSNSPGVSAAVLAAINGQNECLIGGKGKDAANHEVKKRGGRDIDEWARK